MIRIATAAVGLPLALAAVFMLPNLWFFLVVLVVVELAVVEYVRLVQKSAPDGPHWVLLILVPLGALALSPDLWPQGQVGVEIGALWWGALFVAVGIGTFVVLYSVPTDQGLVSLGALAHGLPYFALPVASLHFLQRLDPWLVLLMLAVVWLGDSAAFYCGSRWGRLKMAPRVSPNKTWLGAAASLGAALLAGLFWSQWRLGEVRLEVLQLTFVTSVAGQIGDLVESLIKRGAGVKDSGSLLPGHGGVLDRIDALLFAAPVFLLGVVLIGKGGVTP